jgi:hypothetical protein
MHNYFSRHIRDSTGRKSGITGVERVSKEASHPEDEGDNL